MKHLLILFLSLISAISVIAQNGGYTYYRYNSAGVPERVGYTTPNPDPNSQFSKYIPPVDINLYRETQDVYIRAIQMKQRQFDENVKSLKDLLNTTWIAIDKLEPGDYKNSSIKLLNLYIQEMSKQGIDYSRKDVYDYFWNEIYQLYKDL